MLDLRKMIPAALVKKFLPMFIHLSVSVCLCLVPSAASGGLKASAVSSSSVTVVWLSRGSAITHYTLVVQDTASADCQQLVYIICQVNSVLSCFGIL